MLNADYYRYSVMDKYIIKFCEDMKLPMLDDEEHIKQIENTLIFQRYKLAMLIKELWEEKVSKYSLLIWQIIALMWAIATIFKR